MTAEQLMAYELCHKNGPKFLSHCGATYEIAIKAFHDLALKEKARLDAIKKEEAKLKAESEAMRVKLHNNAMRQKEIMELKKVKDAAQRKLDILLKEVEAEKINESDQFKVKGQEIRAAHEKKLTEKRERSSISAANGCLKLCLKADR